MTNAAPAVKPPLKPFEKEPFILPYPHFSKERRALLLFGENQGDRTHLDLTLKDDELVDFVLSQTNAKGETKTVGIRGMDPSNLDNFIHALAVLRNEMTKEYPEMKVWKIEYADKK